MLAVRRLAAAAHRRIAFVGSVDAQHPQFAERYAGYAEELVRQGLTPTDPFPVPGDDRVEGGRRAVETLLADKEPPDAIFAANDAIALGVLEALARSGVAVPRVFGVVGFDGLAAGEHSNPPLTTIAPDFAEAGRVLVDRATGGGSGPAPRIPVALVERASVR